MTLGKAVVITIICFMAAALLYVADARAADCISYDQTFAGLVARDIKPFTITADRLAKVVEDAETIMGEKYGPVSRAFIIFGGAITVVGFEVDGCLLDPIYLKNPKADVGA